MQLEFDTPLQSEAISCVHVVQEVGPETILLERWSGADWETQLTLRGVGGGVGATAQQRPVAAGAMWRLRASHMHASGEEGWEVF